MGLNVSSSLVIGVPLTRLGEYEERQETKPLFDEYGKPTGKSRVIKYAAWRALNGSLYQFGEEQFSQFSSFGRIRYRYPALVTDDADEESDLVHVSDHDGGYKQVIIGVDLESTEKIDLGDNDGYCGVPLSFIDDGLVGMVKYFLKIRFGYVGELSIFSVPYYSY